MEPTLNAVYFTAGRNYSDHQSALISLPPSAGGHMFNYPGGLDDLGPLLGQAGSWLDSGNTVRRHSLACTARLPLGTTNHVRRLSPHAEGQW